MRTRPDHRVTDRRSLLLNGMTLAGAAALAPVATGEAIAAASGRDQLAQAAAPRAAGGGGACLFLTKRSRRSPSNLDSAERGVSVAARFRF